MRILHELSEEGRTVILITHDNGIAAEAKRVIRIQDGKVVVIISTAYCTARQRFFNKFKFF